MTELLPCKCFCVLFCYVRKNITEYADKSQNFLLVAMLAILIVKDAYSPTEFCL